MIFANLNKTIPFVSDEEIEDSVLYEPRKIISSYGFSRLS